MRDGEGDTFSNLFSHVKIVRTRLEVRIIRIHLFHKKQKAPSQYVRYQLTWLPPNSFSLFSSHGNGICENNVSL